MLATAASAKEATRYPSRHTHTDTFKDQENDKGERPEMQLVQHSGLFDSCPPVVLSQEAQKPQETLLKLERELWQLVALFRAQTTSLIWKVMSQEAKLTFQGVFSHVAAYLKGKNLTTD